ncbi:hypothetical protein C7H19_19420 [Aphanothece hegewaldii CCALA 016]|uniref:Helix-turn-helix domain-containing protein n=1 Tax=Aphanothece hegewaldii CCALA 016 TaxID=2107694 RepID=A0A2T1LTC6_9CHRO|nr:hypothetical protein [Aphanothece hegewaldii]PSF33895.1 hypothetical protein C7H19_19420 [Aphanothece hegewaldii CCALA 016]
MNIKVKFYPLTPEIGRKLRKAKLTAAEWRIWSYLVELDPWGDHYIDVRTFTIMSECDVSKATVYRAIAKFQELELFDFQDKGFSIKNQQGISKLTQSAPSDERNTTSPKKLRKGYRKNETEISKMRLDSQICETSLKNETEISKMRLDSQICENQTPEPLPEMVSSSPQTIQTYSDFKKTLSEDERERFFDFVKQQIKNFRDPIKDLEAWLACKNAAGQNRWEVYYKMYQPSLKNKVQNEDSPCVQNLDGSKTKRLSIREEIEQQRQKVLDYYASLPENEEKPETIADNQALEETEPRQEENPDV